MAFIGRIFIRDFKGFSKDEEVTKTNKAVVEMANSFNLGVDDGDMEELLEVAIGELIEELLELEQECIAEEEARERKLQDKKKKNAQENSQ